MKRHALIFWIAIGLAVLGIVNIVFSGGSGLGNILVPLCVIGVVLLLYKFPPARYRKKPKVKPSARTMEKVAAAKRSQSNGKRKHYPFQVIEGSKGKNDDQQPKYH
ncbi:hypothetical protein CM49_05249 [Paenibacillus sp. P1XP2]|nr:hypothetical protein CM49_05249 [Paenibacillus sp. P1XP2]